MIFKRILIDDYDRIFVSGGDDDDAIVCGDTVPAYTNDYGVLDTSGSCTWHKFLASGNYSKRAGVIINTVSGYNRVYGMGNNNIPFNLDSLIMPGDTFTTFIAMMHLPGNPPPLSVEEEIQASYTIYPNPSSGVFTVRSSGNNTITIRDITGRQIYRNEHPEAEQVIRSDNFSDGVYIVEVSDGVKKSCGKLIIKK